MKQNERTESKVFIVLLTAICISASLAADDAILYFISI